MGQLCKGQPSVDVRWTKLGSVDKFEPITSGSQEQHSKEGFGELVIACGNGAIDLEMTEGTLDPVSLAIETLVVA